MDLDAALAWLRSLPPPAVWGALFLASFVEYLFPPFPGDTLVVGGAALVVAGGLSLPPAAVAVTLGAVLGGLVDLEIGRRLARSGWLDRQPDGRRAEITRLVGWFERYGAAVLAVNRFVPGVRGLFFVAAGLAGVRPAAAAGWATVSAVAWNTLLIGLGAWLGANVEALGRVVRGWNVAVGLFLVALVASWGIGVARRRW